MIGYPYLRLNRLKDLKLTGNLTLTDDQWAGLGTAAGRIVFDDQATDEVNLMACRVGINIATPATRVEIRDGAATQLRLSFAATKFCDFTVDTNHDLTIKPSSTGQIKLQPTIDSVDFFQVLDADGGTPILNVDSANERVGINTATPGAQLELVKDAANATLTISCYHDTEATTPLITLRKADGTSAAPALVDNGAMLGTIHFDGYDGSGWHTAAMIQSHIDGIPSDGTDMGANLSFWTVADDTVTLIERMTLNAGGNVGIGDVNPGKKLDVAGVINTTHQYYVGDIKVVGGQQTHIADATTQDLNGTDTIDETKLESDLAGIVSTINTILLKLEAHGLIASA